MARIRSIKPETWSDQKLARLPRDARLLYIALWNFADEQGRMVGDPRQIKGMCLPMDDDLTPAEVDLLLDDLAKAGRVQRYIVDEEHFLFLPTLSRHQRLDTAQASRFPDPPDHDPASSPQNSGESPDKPGEVVGDPGEVQPRARAYVAGSREQVAGSREVVAFRPDIEQLCDLLADGVQANTGERPKVGKRWHDACRLLLDQDGYTTEQVEALIRWSQADEFWRSNILSMPKLRDKRLNLIGQMQRGNHSKPTSRLLAEDAKLARWADTMEGGNPDAAERMAPHRGQTRRELPRPGPPG